MSEEIKRQQCIASAQKGRKHGTGNPSGQKMPNMSTVTNLVTAILLRIGVESLHLFKN
uniref:hypothetical protein n=1 Tax=Collinsella aerofaciens TaxID=74426 RepID=UPI00359C335F